MAATYDYSYRYQGDARCRFRVSQASGQTVCLATQRQDRWGGSGRTDSATLIATRVEGWRHRDGAGELRGPAWRTAERAEVDALVGQVVTA